MEAVLPKLDGQGSNDDTNDFNFRSISYEEVKSEDVPNIEGARCKECNSVFFVEGQLTPESFMRFAVEFKNHTNDRGEACNGNALFFIKRAKSDSRWRFVRWRGRGSSGTPQLPGSTK